MPHIQAGILVWWWLPVSILDQRTHTRVFCLAVRSTPRPWEFGRISIHFENVGHSARTHYLAFACRYTLEKRRAE